MGFFTVGNLVTLGIALLLLVLFRQMDKNNRHMKRLRDYADTLKKDLTVYMEEHEQAIKDYGIALDVEREAAKELMRRLRKMNEEELAEKAAAMAQLDSQVKLYEGSLAELDRMTSRVQENMNRIRDESSFVEATGKRLKEVQEQLLETGKEVRDMKAGFERENAEALEKAVNMMMADVQSAVSDLSAQAETAQRQVEDHRLAIDKIEERRAEEIARHEEHITELLKMVVDHAGQKADKLEEAALQSLKEQAEERIRRLKAAEEERLKEYQENAKARVLEAKDLISTFRQEWQIERAAWEGRDKELREDRAKGIEEFSSTLQAAEQHLADVKAAFDQQMRDFSQRTSETLAANEALTLKTAEQMKQKALEATGAELEEYRRTQDAEFQRLLSLADDAKKLDGELRQSMQEATGKMREEFALYREEAARAQKAEFDKFSAAASAFKSGMAEIEKELTALKDAAAYNTSGNLKIFEENFQADLAKRNSEIHGRFIAWQNELESRLAAMSVEAEKQRQDMEQSLSGEMRKQFTAQDERLVADLSHLKEETAAFGESIRGQMSAADESLASLKEQLAASFEEAKQGSESFLKAEISKQSLAAAETVKQYQRELDGKFHEMSEYIETRNGEISALVNTSRADLAQAREELAGKIRELDNSIEDARKRVRDVAADNDSRIASVRSSVEDTERHIREAIDQAKLIDKADALRLDLGRRIEDLKADIDRLDQRRAEAFQLENDFVKIKRLEDDVNAKMTRFLSEKRKIETMEADFNRLIRISQSVEEKLTHVTAADDTLQGMQLQLRTLQESLETTEDKFLRIERKNQILDNTNDGIDRNFKVLQESEKITEKIGGDLDRYAEDLSVIKVSIEKLAGESDKAREAAVKIDVLDKLLEDIEERTTAMNRARQWVAEAETRLEKLNKDAQIQTRAIDTIIKGKKGTLPNLEKGTKLPPQQLKENVIRLSRMGWTVKEIAESMKISVGEVELILATAPRD